MIECYKEVLRNLEEQEPRNLWPHLDNGGNAADRLLILFFSYLGRGRGGDDRKL